MANRSTVEINLLGDLYFSRKDPTTLLTYYKDSLSGADLTIGNLEIPLADRGTPSKKWATAKNMRSSPAAIAALTGAGFDAVSLANNHLMDWGGEALAQTLEVLDTAGIAHTGAGMNRGAAFKPAIFDRKGVKIGFLAFTSVFWPEGYAAGPSTPGMATVSVKTTYDTELFAVEQPGTPAIVRNAIDQTDLTEAIAAIKALRPLVDVLIVSWHWGVAHGYGKLVEYQVELGHAAVDAGADIVFGHHPHVIEPIELYKRGIIAYSLGNGIWDAHKSDRHAMLLKCTVDSSGLKRARIVPTWGTTRWEQQSLLPTSAEGEAVIRRLTKMSRRFRTAYVPVGDSALVVKPDEDILAELEKG
jgi:poly-gamma-glutamate synthesis protein (capsule biosynthesis protein)